jgi:4-hydroxy-tetrahydrodipicolinate synthase
MFTGSMVALVTPFKNNKIDEAALRRLIDLQINAGTSVIVPCGTTGESATLNFEEHLRVIEITVDHVKGRVKVLAGAGANSTDEAIYLHKESARLGADGTLQVTPYYNKPPQEGLYQHFSAIAASNDLPIILYNVPGRTSVNMLPDTVARLAKIKTIVGIKEAAGKLEQVKELLEKCPKDFVILSGEDALTLDIYKMGGQGAISVTANVCPRECVNEWSAFKSGDIKKAEEIHQALMSLHDGMFFETNPIPVKAALAMMGIIEEEYRLPLVKMSDGNRKRLQNILQQMKII